METCWLCERKSRRKWFLTSKDGKEHWLCRIHGLYIGQKAPQIDPIKRAEDLGLQITMEEG